MKTPHRFQSHPTAVHLYAQHHSRWKRKNKYRQLKHTITKLKAENKRLKEQNAVISAMLKCIMRTHENLVRSVRELCDEFYKNDLL